MTNEPPDQARLVLDIEGTQHPWNQPTITATDVARLGGWDVGQGVMLIDAENNERQLQPTEAIDLRPGHGFARRIRWRRGLQGSPRVLEELELLRVHYPGLEYVADGQWVRVPSFKRGAGWAPPESDIAFQIPTSFPGTHPYGFFVPAGARFNGALPTNYAEPGDPRPPFPGTWAKFSWQPEGGDWKPAGSVLAGSNLLSWVRGFATRFQEGA